MVEPWVYSSGGRWVDNSLMPTKFAFNDPNFIRGLQFRQDLIYKYKIMPSPSNMKAEMGGLASADLFTNGSAAMFLSGLWHTPAFRAVTTLNWDIVEFPKGPDGKRGFSCGGSGYGIVSNCKNKKAAWEFVKYISGVAGQSKMAATGLICPALKSVMNSPTFLDGKQPANKKMLLSVIPDGVLAPRAKNWREVSEGTIVPTFDHLWLGDYTAQKAVSEVSEKLKTTVLVTK
jgi:multiple sugar transport system substrate-binding protein